MKVNKWDKSCSEAPVTFRQIEEYFVFPYGNDLTKLFLHFFNCMDVLMKVSLTSFCDNSGHLAAILFLSQVAVGNPTDEMMQSVMQNEWNNHF